MLFIEAAERKVCLYAVFLNVVLLTFLECRGRVCFPCSMGQTETKCTDSQLHSRSRWACILLSLMKRNPRRMKEWILAVVCHALCLQVFLRIKISQHQLVEFLKEFPCLLSNPLTVNKTIWTCPSYPCLPLSPSQ